MGLDPQTHVIYTAEREKSNQDLTFKSVMQTSSNRSKAVNLYGIILQ